MQQRLQKRLNEICLVAESKLFGKTHKVSHSKLGERRVLVVVEAAGFLEDAGELHVAGTPRRAGIGLCAGVAVFGGFADAHLGGADVEGTFLAEGAEGVVDEGLGLAFFVAGDVGGAPGDEVLEEGLSGLVGGSPHGWGGW